VRGQPVRLSLWARASEPTKARIGVEDGLAETAQEVLVGPQWESFEVHHRVAADAERLRVLLSATEGGSESPSPALFFDDLSLQDGQGELLRNGSAEAAKRRWEGWAAGYLRLPLWFGQALLDPASYDVASLNRYGFYTAVTFGSFWGDFGWLTLPLPLWAYVLPALATLGAVVGYRWACQLVPESGQRRAVALLALQAGLVGAATLLPMIGRAWQPQGRYLFPALAAWALLFVLGWAGWGERLRWRHWWLVPALGMMLWDAAALFGVVIPHYTV
jgi:hypothetical protein